MLYMFYQWSAAHVAPRMGSVDRNSACRYQRETGQMSLPAWGAWIEIGAKVIMDNIIVVAPRMGSVDRNLLSRLTCIHLSVAPRMGSVDRNIGNHIIDRAGKCRSPHGERGLKFLSSETVICSPWSLPPWGAWIEISSPARTDKRLESLPAWRAWIEIPELGNSNLQPVVAPPMGSVVRNSDLCNYESEDFVAPRMGSLDRNSL